MNNDFEYTAPTSVVSANTDLQTLLSDIANYLLIILGSIAVLIFIWGAVSMILAMGDEEKIAKAKKLFVFAIIGVLAGIFSYIIVEFVIKIVS